MAFDPDAYLASSPSNEGGFDPDAYLADKKVVPSSLSGTALGDTLEKAGYARAPAEPSMFSDEARADRTKTVNELGNIAAEGIISSGVGAPLQGIAAGHRAYQNAVDQEREIVRRVKAGQTREEAEAAIKAAPIPTQTTESHPLYQAGQAVKGYAQQTFPASQETKESLAGQIVGTASAMLPAVGASLALGPAGAALGAAQFGLSAAGDTFEQAIQKGADDETAAHAAGISGVLATVLGAAPLSAVLAPIKQTTPGLAGFAATKLTQAGLNGAVFTGVGEAQHYLNTEIAKAYYDPSAQYSPDLKRMMASYLTGGAFGMMHHAPLNDRLAAARDLVQASQREQTGGEEPPPGAPPGSPAEFPQDPSATPRAGLNDNVRLRPADADHRVVGRAGVGAEGVGYDPLAEYSPEAIESAREALHSNGFDNAAAAEQILEDKSAHHTFGELTPGMENDMSGLVAADKGQARNIVTQTLWQRSREVPERMAAFFNRVFGRPENLFNQTQVTKLERARAADPLYKEYRDTVIPPTPEIEALLPRLKAAGALAAANKSLAVEGLPATNGFSETIAGEHVQHPPGEKAEKNIPTAAAFEYAKEHLDARIQSYLRSGNAGKVRQFTELKKKLVDAIDNHPDPEVAGKWKRARDAYAEPSSLLKAQDLGKTLLTNKVDVESLSHVVDGLTDQQRERAIIGLRNYLERLSNSNRNAARVGTKLMDAVLQPENQEKIRMLMKNDRAADELFSGLTHEETMHNAPTRVIYGSQTSGRETAKQKYMGGTGFLGGLTAHEAISGALSPTHAGVMIGARKLVGKTAEWFDKRRQAKLAELRAETARMFTTQGAERDALVRALLGIPEPEPSQWGRSSVGAAANVPSRPVAPDESHIRNPVTGTPQEKVEQLGRLTEENKPLVQTLIKEIDDRFGTQSKDNVKKPENILSKATRPSILAKKPWFDVAHIRDSYRFKTILNSLHDVPGIVQMLNDKGIEIVKSDTLKQFHPQEWGWRISAFDLRMPNGQLVEYYLPVRELEAAKAEGHKIFEKWRNENPKKLTPIQVREYQKDLESSQRIYQEAWDSYLARSGDDESALRDALSKVSASSSGTSANPPLNTSSAGNAMPLSQASLTSDAASPSLRTSTSPSGFRPTFSPIDNNIGEQQGAGNSNAMRPHRVSTADGESIDVAPRVVEADSILTSQDKGYDPSIQPRERSRAASQAQVRDIASNLDPERLGYSAEADRGAPIVGPDGMVESGNGRVLALRSIYERGGPKAQEYRNWLAQQGVDVGAYKNPILVRQRTTPFTPEQRRAFTVSANQAATLSMSAPERAKADAGHVDVGLIGNSSDLGAAANRNFIRNFVSKLPQSEQGTIMDSRGQLSSEGLARIRNAVLAKAYGDDHILSRIAESTNDEIKSISNALTAAAPAWAKLRGDIESGAVRRDMDITPDLVQAVRRTADIRSRGEKLENYLNQRDAFDKMPEAVEGFMRLFYDPKGRAASSQKIAEAVKYYAQEASKAEAGEGLALGLVPVAPRDIIKLAQDKEWEGHGEQEGISNRGGVGNGESGAAPRGEARGPGAGEGLEQAPRGGRGSDQGQGTTTQGTTREALRRRGSTPFRMGDDINNAILEAGYQKAQQKLPPEQAPPLMQAKKRTIAGQEDLFGGPSVLGEGLRGLASQVPGEREPANAGTTTPVRKPEQLSLFGGGGSGGEASKPNAPIPQQPGGAETSAPGKGESVTKPPDGGERTGEGGTDKPASPRIRGRRDAELKIAERSRANYRITDSDLVGEGSAKQKVRGNIEAIKTLKKIEDEARDATTEEKAILVKYTGWGAHAQDMFKGDYRRQWEAERAELKALLNEEEYASARASTPNAHFTSPDVVRGMWDAMDHLGYEGGSAIEPSAGIGHFIGLIPDKFAPKTAWTAVELDSITGRIAKALYGGAEVNVHGFEDLKRPANHYDLAISNVPFGDYNIKEKPYGSFPIHDFFFVKSLDKVRPGGVVAFITSRYSMDRIDPATRRMLANTSDLVGAIRLPGGDKGAFASNAGTQVTTDIIFLRKKVPGEAPFPGADWTALKEIQTPEGPTKINEYFSDHPEMMLGEMRLQGSMYGKNEPVLIGEAEGLQQKIAEAAKNMPAGAMLVRDTPPPPPVHSTEIGTNIKDGAFFVKDGKLYQRREGQGHAHDLSPDETSRVKKLIGIRDTYNDLMRAQLDGVGDKEALRADLRKKYDNFIEQYGPINKEEKTVTKRLNKAGENVVIVRHPNLKEFRADPDAWKVASIENYDSETGKAKPADIHTKDVIRPPMERQINGPSDALAASLNDKGGVDLDHIAQSLGVDSHEAAINALGDTVYQNPDGRAWETASRYLSGNVVKKLEDARSLAETDPSYLRNVSALEKVQPTPLVGSEITAQFGAPWVPPEVYENFLKEIGSSGTKVVKIPITGDWRVQASHFSADARAKYGTHEVGVDEVAESAMNGRPITVRDPPDRDGTRAINQKKTEEARVKTELLKEAFTGDPEKGVEGWVWQDPERSQLLEGIYNRLHNDLVPQHFDGSHLTLPGLNPDFAGRKHRMDAVWRIIQNGNTLLAHVVGSGKTMTAVAAGMEQKRLGLINKPMYVVPGHMLEQFSREFIQGYPDAKILVASKEEMSPDNRKQFLAKAASNDWDGIIITRDSFGRINMRGEFQQKFIRDQLDELERVMKAEVKEAGKGSQTVKALEKAKKRLGSKLDDLINEEKKDEGTNFEESGVDFLFVDEAHCFPYDTMVTTDRGPLKIGDIVEGRLPVSVASYDHISGEMVWNQIHNYWRHDRGNKRFVIVKTDKSDLYCTSNHNIFVDGRGYVKAEELVCGEILRSMPDHVSANRGLSKVLLSTLPFSSEANKKNLRTMREVVPISELRKGKQRQKKILQQSMCGIMAYGSTGTDGEIYSQDARCCGQKVGRPEIQGYDVGGVFKTNDRSQSNVYARRQRESKCFEEGADVLITRRKWTANKTTVVAARVDESSDGASNPNEAGLWKISKPAAMLQGGFGRSISNASDRSGWEQPSCSEMEISRQAQDGNIECARVVSVEVLKRGSDEEPRTGGPEDCFVYDLGIAGEHNYFANGILVHNSFKNLDFITRMGRVKGLAQNPSQRSTDLFLKLRYLEQNRPGRSAVFMTGTPISNTMAEMWTVQRYLQYDKLKERGLDTFDAWANTFGHVSTNSELSSDGRTFKDVSSFSRFVNIPELISLYSEIADTKTADMLNLPRPEAKTHIVKSQPSSQEEKFIDGIVQLTEELKGKKPGPGPSVMSLTTSGRKVAADGRLVGNTDTDKAVLEKVPELKGGLEFNPRGKVAKAVDNIHRIWQEGKEPATVQMVFLDMGTPKAPKKAKVSDTGETQEEEARINLYDDIKKRLVDKGIPANEIAFIHDANDDIKKARLFQRVRSGDVRVLFGSTEKMGVGTNVQDRLIAMHHLDAPWKPAEVEQRDGRIVRQGNKNPNVDIYRYVTERSFDAFMWQQLERKAAFLNQVVSGAKGSRWAEDIDNPLPDAAQMKAAASGDVRILEHAELDRQVRALTSQKRVYEQTKSRAYGESAAAKSRIEQYENALPGAKEDAGRVTDVSGKNFTVDLGGTAVVERKAAGQTILDRLQKMGGERFYTAKVVNVGRMSGFDMNIEMRAGWDGDGTVLRATPSLKGNAGYASANDIVINEHTDPAGLMRRFENILSSIKTNPDRLESELKRERESVKNLEKTMNQSWPKEKDYQEAVKKLKDLTEAIKAPKHPDVQEDEVKEDKTDYYRGRSIEDIDRDINGLIEEAEKQKPLNTREEWQDFRDANPEWVERDRALSLERAATQSHVEPRRRRASGGRVKNTREESNYSPTGGKPGHHCAVCSMYESPNACSAVAGKIAAWGVCDWYRAKRASGGRVISANINHNPTPAQKEAGNYSKEKLSWNGIPLTIENAKGSVRRGVGKDGKPWQAVLGAHYGYCRQSAGADGDSVDVFLGPHRKSPHVFVIDQIDHGSKKFDEHKILAAFANKNQALRAYESSFSDGHGKDRIGHVSEMTVDQLKDWLRNHDTTKPLEDNHPAAPKVDRSKDVRWMSELSRDGATMFVDRSLPKRVIIKGKVVDPAEPLMRHEMAEYRAMKQAEEVFEKEYGRKPNDSERKRIYSHSHKHFGTPAEQEYLRSKGIDVQSWNAWTNGELAKLEKKKEIKPPPRPDVRVFPHGHDDLEFAG